MNIGLTLRLQVRLLSPLQRAVEVYQASERIRVTVELGKMRMVVPTALVRASALQEIVHGEKYAATVGGMFFVSEMTPKEYRPFAAFHGLADYAAPRGFDVTGLATHFQAIVLELAYARCVLASHELETYLVWRKSVERTSFFSLSEPGLIERVAERMEEHFGMLPKYLEYRRHLLVEVSSCTPPDSAARDPVC